MNRTPEEVRQLKSAMSNLDERCVDLSNEAIRRSKIYNIYSFLGSAIVIIFSSVISIISSSEYSSDKSLAITIMALTVSVTKSLMAILPPEGSSIRMREYSNQLLKISRQVGALDIQNSPFPNLIKTIDTYNDDVDSISVQIYDMSAGSTNAKSKGDSLVAASSKDLIVQPDGIEEKKGDWRMGEKVVDIRIDSGILKEGDISSLRNKSAVKDLESKMGNKETDRQSRERNDLIEKPRAILTSPSNPIALDDQSKIISIPLLVGASSEVATKNTKNLEVEDHLDPPSTIVVSEVP